MCSTWQTFGGQTCAYGSYKILNNSLSSISDYNETLITKTCEALCRAQGTQGCCEVKQGYNAGVPMWECWWTKDASAKSYPIYYPYKAVTCIFTSGLFMTELIKTKYRT